MSVVRAEARVPVSITARGRARGWQCGIRGTVPLGTQSALYDMARKRAVLKLLQFRL